VLASVLILANSPYAAEAGRAPGSMPRVAAAAAVRAWRRESAGAARCSAGRSRTLALGCCQLGNTSGSSRSMMSVDSPDAPAGQWGAFLAMFGWTIKIARTDSERKKNKFLYMDMG
jgi:hypothetical protein